MWFLIHPKSTRVSAVASFFGKTDAKAETPVLWPPHVKS